MKRQIKKQAPVFISILVLVVASLGIAAFLLSNQRFYLPAWVPLIGTDFYEVKAELSTAHAELFRLSPRETEVAAGLLQGHSLESLCTLLGISRNTAKVHLQALFRKTHTSRQSELVHLLADVARN